MAVSSPTVTWCLEYLLFSHPVHQPPLLPQHRQSYNHSKFTKGLSVWLLSWFWISIEFRGNLGQEPRNWLVWGGGHDPGVTPKFFKLLFNIVKERIYEQLCFMNYSDCLSEKHLAHVSLCVFWCSSGYRKHFLLLKGFCSLCEWLHVFTFFIISEKQLVMLRSWNTFLVIPRKQAKNIFFAYPHSDIHKKKNHFWLTFGGFTDAVCSLQNLVD